MANDRPGGVVVPFAEHVGVRVTGGSGGRATAELPSRPELTNHVGSQHAGALYTVAEAASGAAMISGVGSLLGQAVPLVRTSSTAFTKLALGQILATATMSRDPAEVISQFQQEGRADFPVGVSLTDAGGVEVATMTFEWSLRPAKRG